MQESSVTGRHFVGLGVIIKLSLVQECWGAFIRLHWVAICRIYKLGSVLVSLSRLAENRWRRSKTMTSLQKKWQRWLLRSENVAHRQTATREVVAKAG